MANTLKFGNGEWYGKKDTILAYNDENNNYKPLPFDFSRASSATVINKQGLIETVGSGEPRIDYKDDSKGALLLEPTRTNLFPYSEDFENSDWNKNGGTTITNNYAISPDGTLNASRYLGIGTSGLGDKFTLSATSYTISFYVKSNTSENYFCRLIGDSVNVSSNLPITTEWTRLSYTFTGSGLSNKTNGLFRDSSNNDMDILIYGAQLEQGSYATSYIPTQGSAVTRLADSCSQTPPSGIIGQTEGSIFIELDVNSRVLSSSWAFSLNDGTTSNYIGLRRSGGAEFFVHINVSGTTTALIATGVTSGKNKISIGYVSNNIIVYVNGVNVGTDTSSSIPTTSDLQIGNLISNRTLEDSVSGFKLYNTRLSNSELQALTTI